MTKGIHRTLSAPGGDLEKPPIEVQDLVYHYPRASRPAVDGMSFRVEEGEIFGFLGPSGAGKTTTQRILIGLLGGYRGQVGLFGRSLVAWGRELYDEIGVSFELPAGYARLSAREDLAHFACLYGPGGEPAGETVDELLEAVGLIDAADTLVGEYSKGMRIRLNLVRALLHGPRLLFLDEPTSGLDPVSARRVRQLILDRRRRGCTVFLTTHDMAAADALCDRVAFVVGGRIVALDSPRALKLAAGERRIRAEVRTEAGVEERFFSLEAAGGELAALLATGSVETLHTTEASLDDVFVQVTGRRLT